MAPPATARALTSDRAAAVCAGCITLPPAGAVPQAAEPPACLRERLCATMPLKGPGTSQEASERMLLAWTYREQQSDGDD
jgi:hypothetical protein